MRRPNLSRWAFMVSALAVVASSTPAGHYWGITKSFAADVLGAKVGGLLQKAQKALAQNKYAVALSSINEAQAVPNKNAYETYTIAQMQAAVATQAGDFAVASRAYAFLLASPRSSEAVKQQLSMAQATMAYKAKNYDQAVVAIERYLKTFGPDSRMQHLLAQSYYLNHDYLRAARAQQVSVEAALRAGQRPDENQLLFLATCYRLASDPSRVNHTYVLLATYYPKSAYWAMLIHNLASDTHMPEALRFNLARLRLATGVLKTPSEMVDLVERAVQAGLPQLGLRLEDQAFQSGILGKDAGAAREARLHSFVEKRARETRARLASDVEAAHQSAQATPALTAGYNLVLNGHVDEGLALMREGLTKHPKNQARALLLTGMAAYDANRGREAVKTFSSIHADDGSQDLAQLWTLLIKK